MPKIELIACLHLIRFVESNEATNLRLAANLTKFKLVDQCFTSTHWFTQFPENPRQYGVSKAMREIRIAEPLPYIDGDVRKYFLSTVVCVPKSAGRPKKHARFLGLLDQYGNRANHRQRSCNKCGEKGHDIRTCESVPDLP